MLVSINKNSILIVFILDLVNNTNTDFTKNTSFLECFGMSGHA